MSPFPILCAAMLCLAGAVCAEELPAAAPAATLAEAPPSVTAMVPAVLADAVVLSEARPGEFAWEGFEREINWEAYTSSAATARLVDATVHSEGGRSLKLLFRTVANAHKASYGRAVNADWSPYGALLLDVYNPTDLPGLALSVILAAGGRDYEYRTPPLAKGWNRDVRVNLLEKRFSSAATDHQPTGFLADRGRVDFLVLVVHPGAETEGTVYVDHLRLVRAGLLTAGPLALNSTLDVVTSAGRLDDVPPGIRIRSADLSTLEDFEAGAPWTADAVGVAIRPANDFVSHGASALSVEFPASPDGFDVDLNGLAPLLAGRRQLRMDVYCAGPWASVALILTGAEGSEYTSGRWFGHGWSTRVFDLTNPAAWEGGTLTPEVLAGLTGARLRITSRHTGRLVFDGLSAGDLRLNGAARGGGLLSFAYHPAPGLEGVVNARVENTYYGSSLSDPRTAGSEGFLESANLRADLGEFRSALLYRKRINPMDQPMYLLVSPWSLGQEIAGFETAGRAFGTELQALAASRLEYDRFNSRRPTGFGPEGVLALRARRTVTEATRIGATYLHHVARYDQTVAGLPAVRRTLSADAESHVGGKAVSLGGSVEGGVTLDVAARDPGANAPRGDRGYFGGTLKPKWGRLRLEGSYTLFGYDFDADLATYGPNWAGPGVGGGVDLDGLAPARWLAALPLYDRSAGNNLALNWSWNRWSARDRYTDAATGRLVPRSGTRLGSVRLENDEKARPNFSLEAEFEEYTDQWYRSQGYEEEANLRLPLPLDVVAWGQVKIAQGRSFDLTTGEGGESWRNRESAGCEKRFKSNLFLGVAANFEQSREAWEAVWSDPDAFVKFSGSARQTLGANSVVELKYGAPALLGSDYGVRGTIDVWTLTAKVYF